MGADFLHFRELFLWLRRHILSAPMKAKTTSKCLKCSGQYVPDHRNRKTQSYCAKAECRKESKAESQKRWLGKPENQARLGDWALSWSSEGEDVERILTDWLDDLELRLKNEGNEEEAPSTKVFLLTPRLDVDLPLPKGGWTQEDFPF